MKNNQPTNLEHQRKWRGRNKDKDIYKNYKTKREKSNQSFDTELILKTDDLQIKNKNKILEPNEYKFWTTFRSIWLPPQSGTPPHTYTYTESSWSCRAKKEETNGETEENQNKLQQEKNPRWWISKELVTINRTSRRAIRTRIRRRDVKSGNNQNKKQTNKWKNNTVIRKTGKLNSRREKNM